MKDIKIQNVNPVAEPKAAEKAGRKGKVTGQSFSETLKHTVANLNDLNRTIPADAATGVADAKSSTIQDEISNAKDNFDRMMMEKQNLFQLYQRITNKEDA
jgi:hypothetical protein